ncbi:hypothetical protein [Frondihabitans sp. PhB188]|uniref:hypothetical protein n=1 Tax=Frondihabitans sp. PhB188 TaxID=2485200 RepID=UPI000F49593A|nr:hypothetical protein [Frondihabitans sp. PhB188]
MEALPASRDTLAGFLDAFPAAWATQVGRLQVILAVHAQAGIEIDAPRLTGHPDSLWTARPGLLDPQEALMQLPRYRFPVGLVGRRDGFLIVLTGTLGFTRNQARTVTPNDISIYPGHASIRGHVVPAADVPGECPRCAVAAWLMVIAPHYERLRGSYLPLLDPTTADPPVHGCQDKVGVLWRAGVALLPSIDQTGAVGTGRPISVRTITTIISHRRTPTGQTEKLGPLLAPVGRYRNATSHELVAAQDDVLDQIDSANAYLENLLAEAHLLKERTVWPEE